MRLNLNRTEPLPPPAELHQKFPIGKKRAEFVEKARLVVADIMSGQDTRKLLIVGPCSVHDTEAAKVYAGKLKTLQTRYADRFYLVMRAYFEKPRTTIGWKGLLYDPHLDGSNAIADGLDSARRLLLDLADLEIPVASEFVDPIIPMYIGDLITWAGVGARTASSQIHRQMASTLPMPVGFKNSTDGNLESAIQAIVAAASPHTFIGMCENGQAVILHSNGNRECHVVLRGAEDHPNFDRMTIDEVAMRLREWELSPRLIVDCSHDNAGKDHRRQPLVFRSLIHQIRQGCSSIAGFMLESYLAAGRQAWRGTAQQVAPELSLTDPCISFEQTEELLEWGYHALSEEAGDFIRSEPDQEIPYAPQFAQ